MELDFPWPDQLEPDELAAVCDNPAFRALVAYCQGHRQHWPGLERFDRDELGIDPEEDAED